MPRSALRYEVLTAPIRIPNAPARFFRLVRKVQGERFGVDAAGMQRMPRRRATQVRSLPARAARALIALCLLFALAAIGIGVIGIVGVRSTTTTARDITGDELATATSTSRVARAMDVAYAKAEQLAAGIPAAERARLAAALFDQVLPAADASLVSLVALHAPDGTDELADVDLLRQEWETLRALARSAGQVTEQPGRELAPQLTAAFEPLSAHLDRLISREDVDARLGEATARATMTRTLWVIGIAIAAVLLAALAVARVGIRRVRRALRPEERQVEFAQTMQLAEDEQEAHDLLKRHLERAVGDSSVTVLNRNNSADRLEAVTALDSNSCLIKTLQHATPRACLAVRSGRTHHQGPGSQLLDCGVCGGCSGSSTCTPLTVGGEVIGSVLVNPPYVPTPEQNERIQTSVAQAAPILANLRNLAIAELRAATDALTGLPNKRAVNDTLKRMLAQASRTISPFALVLLDVDHFKEVNDRLGHPVGDQALASVGAALASSIRDSDFAGRNGGEEFAILLPHTDQIGALEVAEKIRLAVAAISLPDGASITASLGVAVYPDNATTTEKLERLADAALYVAKRSGRNRTELAGPTAPVAAVPA